MNIDRLFMRASEAHRHEVNVKSTRVGHPKILRAHQSLAVFEEELCFLDEVREVLQWNCWSMQH
jgi:hypothetical protein